jgi:2-C-methyl-D-erythritol 2,4-cyclodiphosphate synthase
MIRIGHGYDVHRFAPERKLILGGVSIPYEMGLAGHSDADVLVHALMDAMLGAMAKGDIGKHFPDTDNSFKDIDSMILFKRVCEIMKDEGYSLSNADCTVFAQAPKLAPHIEAMRKNIAAAAGIDISQINIKATTEEKLGFTGRKEGISAHAVCLLEK